MNKSLLLPLNIHNDLINQKSIQDMGTEIEKLAKETREEKIQQILLMRSNEYLQFLNLEFDYVQIMEHIVKVIRPIERYDKSQREKMIVARHRKQIDFKNSIYKRDEVEPEFQIDENKKDFFNKLKLHVFIFNQQTRPVQSTPILNIKARTFDDPLYGQILQAGIIYRRIHGRVTSEEKWGELRDSYILVLYDSPQSLTSTMFGEIPYQRLYFFTQDYIENIQQKSPGLQGPADSPQKNNQYQLTNAQKSNLVAKPNQDINKLPVTIQKKISYERYFSLTQFDEKNIVIWIDRQKHADRWIVQLMTQVAKRSYFFICGWINITPEPILVDFYDNKKAESLIIKLNSIKVLKYKKLYSAFKEIAITFYHYTFYTIQVRPDLIEIDLSNLGLNKDELLFFFDVLQEPTNHCRFQILKLEKNNFDNDTIQAMAKFLTSEYSFYIQYLSLSNNENIGDYGCHILGNSILQRHVNIIQMKVGEEYQLPFLYLGMSNIQMSDQGLFNLTISFEQCHKVNMQRGMDEYDDHLSLNISNNDITENSLRSLGNFLRKFNGISQLNIQGSYRIESLYNEYFFESLIENYSLVYLDMSFITLNINSYKSLMYLLEHNITLQYVKITINDEIITYMQSNKNNKILKTFLVDYKPQDEIEETEIEIEQEIIVDDPDRVVPNPI